MSDKKINLRVQNDINDIDTREVILRVVMASEGTAFLEMKDSGSESPEQWWALLEINSIEKYKIEAFSPEGLDETIVRAPTLADIIKT